MHHYFENQCDQDQRRPRAGFPGFGGGPQHQQRAFVFGGEADRQGFGGGLGGGLGGDLDGEHQRFGGRHHGFGGRHHGFGGGPHRFGGGDMPNPFEPFGGADRGGFGFHGGRGGFPPAGRRGGPFECPMFNPYPEGFDSDETSDCERRRHRIRERRRRHGLRGGRRHPGRFGRCPHSDEEDANDEIVVETLTELPTDFQVIQNEIEAEMEDLQLHDHAQPKEKTPKKCFKLALSVDGFKGKEIRIRRHQNQLFIDGKQEKKTELGEFCRSFAHKINIPAGIDSDKIKIRLSPHGILCIKAKQTPSDSDDSEVQEIIQ